MNKTTFFTAVILSFGLLSAQAADKVLFEDSSFSKEGWSEFAEIPGTGGWEVKRRKLGELAQAVVQEVTIEGAGGIFLSAGEGSYASVFRSEDVIYAMRSRNGEQSLVGQADVTGKADCGLASTGHFSFTNTAPATSGAALANPTLLAWCRTPAGFPPRTAPTA